ncbi:MAG: methionyl-tRNA formyltransferase [Deltaproteobacteria bacterium]|nr:methionyl-tRNA formyltransferase [Deltaproteobacteria bacterium]
MGTPDFAVPTLKALIQNGHHILSVVTQPDRPKGRGKNLAASPVKELAVEHGIEVLQPERVSDPAFCSRVRAQEPDIIIVVAFGQILRKSLLEIPTWKAINIHASLLPKYRGAAPIQWAILHNEPQTGLSVMHMDEGLDTGPVLFQKAVRIKEDETAGQLHDRLALLGGDLIITALSRIAAGILDEQPQDHSKATYAPKIDKGMAHIDWTKDADYVSGLIRALDPRPGAYAIFGDNHIKLFSPRPSKKFSNDLVPGRVRHDMESGLAVETRDGALEIGEVQYPGKKRLSSRDFLRGFSLPDGTILG